MHIKGSLKLVERFVLPGALAGLAYLAYAISSGKDGWLRVHELRTQIERQAEENRRMEVDNSLLRKQVSTLKRHPDSMEGIARYQLNMIRPGEVFIQIPPVK